MGVNSPAALTAAWRRVTISLSQPTGLRKACSLFKDLSVEQIQQQITDGLAGNKPIYLVTPVRLAGDPPPITFGIFIIYYWHTFTVIGLSVDGTIATIYNPHGGLNSTAHMSFAEIKNNFMSTTSLTVAQNAF